ncbi:hypothetical protein [Leucobacter sp. NPDC077196]|uniref:hypothetical protein n=1 Tax=Leucobacter sp. NPDC077196 TaxID=3154959 RepID=UPI003431A048
MAAPTAAQKAAGEKAAADAAAAEQLGGADAPSVESDSEIEPERDLYLVTGAAVVLRTDDGFERYLYRGANVDGAAFSQSSIDHAISNGLIAGTE